MVARWFLDAVGFDLDFVSAAQIDATVGISGAVKFDMQFKIFESGIVDQFRTVSRPYHVTVFDLPHGSICSVHPPSTHIFSVEQLNRLPPLGDTFSLQSRRSPADPLPGGSVWPSRSPRQGLADESAFENHILGSVFLLFGRNESEAAIRQLNFGKRSCASPTAHHLGFQLSTLLVKFQPRGIFPIGCLQRQIPAA